MNGFEPEIVQEFLAESFEQIDALDRDLLALEQTPQDSELINRIFRAVHTIKGSAAFLALAPVVDAAHAAETALHAARAGRIQVDRPALDAFLAVVDAIRKQLSELRAGSQPQPADSALLALLGAIGHAPSFESPEDHESPAAPLAFPPPAPTEPFSTRRLPPEPAAPAFDREPAIDFVAPTDAPNGTTPVPALIAPSSPVAPLARRPLSLPDNKAVLVEFLIQDLRDTLAQIEEAVATIADPECRARGWGSLVELIEALRRTAVFFEFPVMNRLCESIGTVAAAHIPDESLDQVLPRLLAAVWLLKEQAAGLEHAEILERPADSLCAALASFATGARPEPPLGFGASACDALIADRAITSPEDAPDAQTLILIPGTSAAKPCAAEPAPSAHAAPPAPAVEHLSSCAQTPVSRPEPFVEQPAVEPVAPVPVPEVESLEAAPRKALAVEPTIRVETGRLEALLNLVGELVLQKNRLAAIARRSAFDRSDPHELSASLTEATDGLERVTDDLQLAVMRTRMQPLGKLFGKYPRLVRDLARQTGKEIRLVVEGAQTEVDRSVIEELADPLMHLLRNAADHGIESPTERAAVGKDLCGTLSLQARHAGGSVEVSLSDDGRGFSRDRIARRAVQLGFISEHELPRMSDREVFALAFAPGFSTSETVTDISGRGVGMDVVRTNIERINGAIHLSSVEGRGTTITIKIPLTVAIMDAMMVRIGTEVYALPLTSVVEIVKPTHAELASVYGLPVLRLRDAIIPVLSGARIFGVADKPADGPRTIIILNSTDEQAGLEVSEVLGQQEVVVKRLDSGPGSFQSAAPVSGATVRHDGGVSLIVDVAEALALGRRLFAASNAPDNRARLAAALERASACAA